MCARLQISLLLPLCDGVALVELLQDGSGVLAARQLDDQQVHARAHHELIALEPLAVEEHLHRTNAERAALVHTAALGGGSDLAL